MAILRLVDNVLDATEQFEKALGSSQRESSEPNMSDLTREEVKARLEATEARAEKVAAEIRSELTSMKGDILNALTGFREETRVGLAETSAAVKVASAELRAEGKQDQVLATRWQIGVIVTIILAAVAGIVTTLNTRARTAPAAAPYIIQIPAQAAPAAASPAPPQGAPQQPPAKSD